jgi:hypothetical protein
MSISISLYTTFLIYILLVWLGPKHSQVPLVSTPRKSPIQLFTRDHILLEVHSDAFESQFLRFVDIITIDGESPLVMATWQVHLDWHLDGIRVLSSKAPIFYVVCSLPIGISRPELVLLCVS